MLKKKICHSVIFVCICLFWIFSSLCACVNAPNQEIAWECENRWHLRVFTMTQFIFQFVYAFLIPFIGIQYLQNRRDLHTVQCIYIMAFVFFLYLFVSMIISFTVYTRFNLEDHSVLNASMLNITCYDIYTTTGKKGDCGVNISESFRSREKECDGFNFIFKTLYGSQYAWRIFQIFLFVSLFTIGMFQAIKRFRNIKKVSKAKVDFSMIGTDRVKEHDLF